MSILLKVWKNRSLFRSLPYSIYFNFYYLPIKQAWKLPIILYKPELIKMKGKVVLDAPKVKTGMIRMGFRVVSLYPNNGVTWENHGGTVIFKGKCDIGNGAAISIGNNGNIEFGDNFICTSNLKLVSYCSVKFGKNALIAWEVIIMDTSFHKLKTLDGSERGETMTPIIIGNNNWIPARCMVLKGTKTPDNCVFGADSVLNKDYTSYPANSLLAGNPIEVKVSNVWRDVDDYGMT